MAATTTNDRNYRLPRKGDRVRFWRSILLLSGEWTREQVTASVQKRRGARVDVVIDGLAGEWTTPTRKMEIL